MSDILSERFVSTVCARVAANKRVRRSLPGGGRLHIDRQLPFLCVYRCRAESEAAHSERLVTGEASYLILGAGHRQQRLVSQLVEKLAGVLQMCFGACLVMEVWLEEAVVIDEPDGSVAPGFRIVAARGTPLVTTLNRFEKQLTRVRVARKRAVVDVDFSSRVCPPGMRPLLTRDALRRTGSHLLGVAVRPVHWNKESGQVYPLLRRELHRGFARALKHALFAFTHAHTTQRPPHYQALGRWSVVKAVWEVDRRLAALCEGYDLLLQVTPTNIDAAWHRFERSRYSKAPVFTYRPLSVDPCQTKRRLQQIPVERIEDPTLAELFREQQLDLDRQFTMLLDLGTPRFRYGGMQLYGEVDDALMTLAEELLRRISPRSRESVGGRLVDAQAFASRAQRELDIYRDAVPDLSCTVTVCDDISGLLVSRGNLLIGSQLKVPASRLEALIQHEIGTHVLTYLNGCSQPFQQLRIGLPGYEELQEGLAVLAEYLVGGLTRSRLRLLAARVVAVRHMLRGGSFVEVYGLLNREYGIERRQAFGITVRTFRGGGLSKDAVYLRGFVKVLEYLKNGHALKPLYAGKISSDHVSIVRELQWRKVLREVPLCPAFLEEPRAVARLKRLETLTGILDLL